ncbi:UNVERIFIED_CONTAM: hypothetical protein NCL1_08651 [Trichonephila clavipes]
MNEVLVLIKFPARPLLFKNIFYEHATLSRMNNFVVLIVVLYDLLWFINEVETDQAIEEPAEIMHMNQDSENKYEKSDRHENFELN